MFFWLTFPHSYFSCKQWLIEVYSTSVFTDATSTPALCLPCNSISLSEWGISWASPASFPVWELNCWSKSFQALLLYTWWRPDKRPNYRSWNCFFSNLLSHVSVNFFLVFIMISEPHDLFPGLCVLEVTIRCLPEVQACSIWVFPEVLRYISRLLIDMK